MVVTFHYFRRPRRTFLGRLRYVNLERPRTQHGFRGRQLMDYRRTLVHYFIANDIAPPGLRLFFLLRRQDLTRLFRVALRRLFASSHGVFFT